MSKHSLDFRLKKLEAEKTETITAYPDNILDWITQYRPFIGKTPQSFLLAPFWRQVLLDEHMDISCACGRQTRKSTNACNILAFHSTVKDGVELSYIVDSEERKSTFSEKRLRQDTFMSNPKLAALLPSLQANINRIRLLNGNMIYCLTDHRQYSHVEGKSNHVVVADEIQKQESQFFSVVNQTLTETHGRVYRFGIGGEAGSPWQNHWDQTDQHEWFYDNENWRDELTFSELGHINNSQADLEKILAGKWIATKPENTIFRGYHMPQRIFPTIPLTIKDAIEKYKVHPSISIEYRKAHDPLSIFLPHVEGAFYKSIRRPITFEMVRFCYDYTQCLLAPEQIAMLKKQYKNEIRIVMGIDWGSSPTKSQTACAVLIHWRKLNRYQLAHLEIAPEEDVTISAVKFVKTFQDFKCDYCIADLGYGRSAVTLMQDGGHDVLGNTCIGLTRGKVMGCWTTGGDTSDTLAKKQESDIEGIKQLPHITITKNETVQAFVDLIAQKITMSIDDKQIEKSKFIIPMLNEYETDMLIHDFCSITRKDIDQENEGIRVDDPRKVAKREFNHPPDTAMAIMYAMEADKRYSEDAFTIMSVRKKKY